MANLTETPQWEAGVYQLETSDPVLGGPEGISNQQGKQLANRTAYLKQQVDSQAGSKVSKSGDTMTGKLLGKAGAATPNNVNEAGFGFAGDPDTGLFSPADGVLQLASNGEVVFENNAQGSASFKKGVRVPKGAPDALDGNSVAGYSFDQDGDTGLFAEGGIPSSGSDLVLRVDSAELIRIKSTGAVLFGAPTVPTPAQGDNSMRIVNSAFVQQAIAALVNSSPAALDTLVELAAALGNDANFATTMTNALSLKAPLASPTLTGNPTAPTPAQFDNDTSLATTAFTRNELLGLGNAVYDALFGKSLSSNGYQKFPGGMILQWGSVQVTMAAANTLYSTPVTFPIAFPVGALAVHSTPSNVPAANFLTTSSESFAASGFNLVSVVGSGAQSGSATNIRWWAIGK